MRGMVVLLVAAVLAPGFGQIVEKTIQLPDSLGVLASPDRIVYNPCDNTVIVGGHHDDAVIVIDAGTRQKVARVPIPGGVQDIGVSTQENKVYVVSDRTDSLVVLDSSHRRAHALALGSRVHELCYNPTANKLYCTADTTSDSLVILDCRADTILARIDAGSMEWYVSVACSDPLGNKVYCSDNMHLVVVDGAGDSVLKVLPWVFDYGPADVAYNPASQKVYCVSAFAGLRIVDAVADTVLRRGPVIRGSPTRLSVSPPENKVYVASDVGTRGLITVVSGSGDSALAAVGLSERVLSLVCDLVSRVAVCGARDRKFYGISGSGDTLVDSVRLRDLPAGICTDSSGTVYVANSEVTVVDGRSFELVERVPLSFSPIALLEVPVAGKVYAASVFEEKLVVVDAGAGRVTGSVVLPLPPDVLCGVPGALRLYCGGRAGPGLVAVDCAGDSVLATVELGHPPAALAYAPGPDKLYCADAAGARLSVVDCSGDSVVARVAVGAYPMALAHSAAGAKVYAANWSGASVSVVSTRSDSILATVPVGLAPGVLLVIPELDVVCSANCGDNTVTVISGSGDTTLATVPVGERPAAMLYQPDANRLYCANARSDDVTVIDCATWQPVRTVAVGNGPVALGGRVLPARLYCVCYDDDEVVVIDAGPDTVAARLGVGDQPAAIARVGDSRFYMANSGSASLSVLYDPAAGIGSGGAAAAGARLAATVVSGTLRTEERGPETASRAELLDATGRKVMELKPGPNDVRRVPAGVYFVREAPIAGRRQPHVRKVVIQH